MLIHLWRGYHNEKLLELLKSSWENGDLVILIPLQLKDFSFSKKIESKKIHFHGDWSDDLKNQVLDFEIKETHSDLGNAVLGVFTSGTTTGINRLIFYSKENVTSSLDSIRELFDKNRIKKIFCYPQPTHTFGLILGYMQSVLFDVALIFHAGPYSRETHLKWFQNADQETITLGAPAHFLDLMSFLKTENLNGPSSYSAIVGGARVSVKLWEQMQNTLKIEAPSVGYGATEASPGVTHLPPGIKPSEDGDIGYALRNVEIKVKDHGLEFKGPNVCYRILENNQFTENQKILLSDAVVMKNLHQNEKKPRYTFLGRTDCMMNRGGIKISLEHIESVLFEKTQSSCLAVSLYDPRLGDELGVVVNSENFQIKYQIQDIVKTQWGFHIPDSSIFVGPVPFNANGKNDRVTAVTCILKQKKWTFPVAIENLRSMLPHRGPAIWIDELLDAQPHMGEASVKIDKCRNYFGPEQVSQLFRETSCVEWVAQTYGYATAMGDILGVHKAAVATRTFIAEVKSAEFYTEHFESASKNGEEIKIKVKCTHDFGKLRVVEGHVYHNTNLLAQISVKLFCD
jgi:acyl-coenzyme A synthetase/AMP-(fatty) acid ligase